MILELDTSKTLYFYLQALTRWGTTSPGMPFDASIHLFTLIEVCSEFMPPSVSVPSSCLHFCDLAIFRLISVSLSPLSRLHAPVEDLIPWFNSVYEPGCSCFLTGNLLLFFCFENTYTEHKKRSVFATYLVIYIFMCN